MSRLTRRKMISRQACLRAAPCASPIEGGEAEDQLQGPRNPGSRRRRARMIPSSSSFLIRRQQAMRDRSTRSDSSATDQAGVLRHRPQQGIDQVIYHSRMPTSAAYYPTIITMLSGKFGMYFRQDGWSAGIIPGSGALVGSTWSVMQILDRAFPRAPAHRELRPISSTAPSRSGSARRRCCSPARRRWSMRSCLACAMTTASRTILALNAGIVDAPGQSQPGGTGSGAAVRVLPNTSDTDHRLRSAARSAPLPARGNKFVNHILRRLRPAPNSLDLRLLCVRFGRVLEWKVSASSC